MPTGDPRVALPQSDPVTTDRAVRRLVELAVLGLVTTKVVSAMLRWEESARRAHHRRVLAHR